MARQPQTSTWGEYNQTRRGTYIVQNARSIAILWLTWTGRGRTLTQLRPAMVPKPTKIRHIAPVPRFSISSLFGTGHSLLSRRPFPDRDLKIPCSARREIPSENGGFPRFSEPAKPSNRPRKLPFPCKLPVKQGNQDRDWFAPDCVAHHFTRRQGRFPQPAENRGRSFLLRAVTSRSSWSPSRGCRSARGHSRRERPRAPR